ncbi:hypothetical protein GDO86_003714 [Hymenochirus boettgeri]|uniref:S100P-binding protein n=1 Tax=Hymenochirus boettgeri TaxID=247094 RepID=A0A8T2K722_9PIPI|nr:hypothetical protein GDO86_003714 [Hymenochirus boettgeri]KAG8451625.1 hypothetical protein GDO86_003714 [Hymenochirus boettgeri]
MKASFDRSGSTKAYTDRQVVLFKTSFEDTHSGIMEDLRINIVNDKALGNKRNLEDLADVSPVPKKLRSAVVLCSTPLSFPHCSQNTECDDSLLEMSDEESDSPIHMTLAQIEQLLEDECEYAASSGWDGDTEVNVLRRELLLTKSDGPHEDPSDCRDYSCSSHFSQEQLNNSLTLTEETLYSDDTSNYATMAPSPSFSVGSCSEQNKIAIDIGPVICARKSPLTYISGQEKISAPEFSDMPSDDNISTISTSQLPTDLEVIDELSEGSTDLPFDGDIEELLTLSPVDSSSPDEDTVPVTQLNSTKKSTSTTLVKTPVLSLHDPSQFSSTNCAATSEPSCSRLLPTALLAASTESLDSLRLPESESNTNPKDSETFHLSPSPNISKPDTIASVQNGVKQKENNGLKDINQEQSGNATTAVLDLPLTDNSEPTHETQQNLKIPKIECKNEVNPAKPEENIEGTAASTLPLRPQISPRDMEIRKDNYCNAVQMHFKSCNSSEDPYNQLAFLCTETDKGNPAWKHRADFTKRNYFSRKRPVCCSLKEWVRRNGGSSLKRFHGLPCTFRRSPMPGVLPPGPS